MSTEKQLAANRLNAQKSTGPKTPQGKARVAANAVTHGLTAACPVLASEDPDAYARFRTGMAARLAPAGDIETLLADRVINLAWRLQRAQNYESFVLDNLIRSAADNPAPDVPASPDASVDCISRQEPAPAKAWGGNPASSETVSVILAQILLDDFTGPQVLEKLQRYESRIERSFYKALKELQTTQSLNPMISPGKDNFSLSPHRGIEESSQRGGPARPGLTVERSVPSIHSNRVVDHPIKPNPHDPRRGYVDKPNPVPPRGTDVVVDHPIKPNPHDPRRGYVDKPNPVPPRGTDVVVDHTNPQSSIGNQQSSNPVNPVKSSKPEVKKTITLPDHLAFQSSLDNPQSPIFSSAVLNKLLQNKPNLPVPPSRLCR